MGGEAMNVEEKEKREEMILTRSLAFLLFDKW